MTDLILVEGDVQFEILLFHELLWCLTISNEKGLYKRILIVQQIQIFLVQIDIWVVRIIWKAMFNPIDFESFTFCFSGPALQLLIDLVKALM